MQFQPEYEVLSKYQIKENFQTGESYQRNVIKHTNYKIKKYKAKSNYDNRSD